MNTQFIVSTDLDGTLLDHYSYSWEDARPAIEKLIDNDIPIIFNTSKTLAEALTLQKAMGIAQPAIVENGSAIAIPHALAKALPIPEKTLTTDTEQHTIVHFGIARSHILDFIDTQKSRHGEILESYRDWSIERIAEKTGLNIETAKLSSDKAFSEPFVWLSDKATLSQFIRAAEKKGLKVLQGGRFYHLLGDSNKAKPLEWFKHLYEQVTADSTCKLICLGDNKNDIHMLNIADYPVCIKSPTSDYPEISENPNTIRTEDEGPIGWNLAILDILSNNKKNTDNNTQ